MASEPPANAIKIAALAEVQKKGELKFGFKEDGIPREGFLALFNGTLVAYENRCKHLPVSLDYGDGKFFTPGKDYFICRTHGAVYKPDTGECVRGPCVGASLRKLEITEVGGIVYLLLPPTSE